ncbi:DNA-binding response OmpR family regulator [Kibdelosporangium banguiense]|uniref:DNA-binding response OmpR family regulator n=1 Tax=Kibdelosporangium banguiense TaxID=1365924 RepID=A0ABS4TP19_9PSEU|nr:DNA-binding response OmpR family regulator [Kibdelosporangium banguiense]
MVRIKRVAAMGWLVLLMLSHVWGYDFDPGSNVVDVYVRTLRRKIGAEHIETVRGMGYRLG